MAVPTVVSTTAFNSPYTLGFTPGVGANKEDLLDQIINIDPFDTPWVSQAPKTTAKHVYHQWLNDTLGEAVTTGVALEGADFSMDSGNGTGPSRSFNITSILRQDIGVTETQRAIDSAGFADIYAYELQKATKRLAIKLEKLVFTAMPAASTATGNYQTERVMRNLQTFITTNTAYAGTNSLGRVGGSGNASAAGSAASAGLLTAGDFNDMLEKIYKAGGNPEQVYVSPKVKRQISAFTVPGMDSAAAPFSRNIAASDKKLISSIDFYDTDFGIIQIVLDRWVPEATNTSTALTAATDTAGVAFFLQRSMNRLAWLRPMTHQFMGKRGDSVVGSIIGEVTLEVLAEKANGIIKSINNKSHAT